MSSSSSLLSSATVFPVSRVLSLARRLPSTFYCSSFFFPLCLRDLLALRGNLPEEDAARRSVQRRARVIVTLQVCRGGVDAGNQLSSLRASLPAPCETTLCRPSPPHPLPADAMSLSLLSQQARGHNRGNRFTDDSLHQTWHTHFGEKGRVREWEIYLSSEILPKFPSREVRGRQKRLSSD